MHVCLEGGSARVKSLCSLSARVSGSQSTEVARIERIVLA